MPVRSWSSVLRSESTLQRFMGSWRPRLADGFMCVNLSGSRQLSVAHNCVFLSVLFTSSLHVMFSYLPRSFFSRFIGGIGPCAL